MNPPGHEEQEMDLPLAPEDPEGLVDPGDHLEVVPDVRADRQRSFRWPRRRRIAPVIHSGGDPAARPWSVAEVVQIGRPICREQMSSRFGGRGDDLDFKMAKGDASEEVADWSEDEKAAETREKAPAR
jgi:hypothetical protein